ncbi:MAG TPA: PASTA domain-containing protein [Solirubrobacterales bacterium]|nr:PASTA domain-containing protein [Solirubrobacterales bacterium]
MAIALLLALVGGLALTAPAGASELPECKGLAFNAIVGPDEPGECTYRMQLQPEQEAVQEDEHTVAVYWTTGGFREHLALFFVAPEAHDAIGTAVPTTIALSEGDLITLAVHHRVGDPAALGAPFTYPIVEGPGWKGGFQTNQVQMPPPEQPPTPPAPQPTCHVPSLKHDSLGQARAQLRAAGCALAGVHRRPGVTARSGRVVKQSAPAGTEGALAFAVTVTLGRPA